MAPNFLNTTNPIAKHTRPTLDQRRCPPVIPPEHTSRTLVLCFDGTGDANSSNIVQLVSLLKNDDSTNQLVYYQPGIGAYYDTDRDPIALVSTIRKVFLQRAPNVLTLSLYLSIRAFDEMVAWSIDTHIMAGYKFLMQNYTEGDKICLFGFSRGAYTARSLAGMLHKVGLLPPGNFEQVPFAYKMYTQANKNQSLDFKPAFRDVPIEFIGVWDTVSSLGAVLEKSLPATTANPNVRTFRHALSLDERRSQFQAQFWKEKQTDFLHHDGGNHYTKTDVEEVWFAGCHADVGGGSESTIVRRSLARISLRWMIRECFKSKTGIMFNSHSLANIGLNPSTLYPLVTPRPGALPVEPSHRIQKPSATPIPINLRALSIKKKKSDFLKDSGCEDSSGTEEEEELRDALAPKYDQLSLRKIWWIFEIIPFVHIYHHEQGGHYIHLGRPRRIPHQKPNEFKVHRSVYLRMNAEFENERARKKGKKYTPKARFEVEPTWVD